MARTSSRDTRPEIELRRRIHRLGLRFRVDRPVFVGVRRRADLVFASARLAVFVDGCFWHGCPEHVTWPKTNAEFWREKIEANRQRDRDTDERLELVGWQPIRIWEHEDPGLAAARIASAVKQRSPAGTRDARARA
jgi:DNA mismatch endonuclease, patch repair protein